MNEQQEIYGIANMAIKHLKETYPCMLDSQRERYIEAIKNKIEMLDSKATQQYLLSKLERKLEVLNERRCKL